MTSSRRVRFAGLLPWLLAAAFIEWLGTGLFLAVSAIFFVTVVGLSAPQVGLGMAVAGAVAIGTALPIGHLADRFGPRTVLVAVNLARAGATAGYLLVDGWWSFLGVSVVVAVTEQAAPPLIQALVGEAVRSDLRTRVMAAHRTVLNLGISAGGLVAGVVLGSGLRGGYQILLLADALAFLAAVPLLLRVTGQRRARVAPGRGRWAMPRDRKLLGLTAYDGIIMLWQPMLNVAFPLWLATRTDMPIGLVGALYAVNTVTCVVLQYPISALAATPRRALRSYAVAAAALAAASVTFAVAPAVAGTATVAVFVMGVGLLTFAELAGAGAAWTLSFAIAPDDRRGTYLAAFGVGRTISTRVAGPLLMTGIVLTLGARGWLLLAVLFALATVPPLVAARRDRRPGAGRALPLPDREVVPSGRCERVTGA